MGDKFSEALKEAVKNKDQHRVSTIRLIMAAIKDREIALRSEDKTVSENDILQILQKMVRQRQESAETYENASRPELADQEREEIRIIEGFLPRQMDENETRNACEKAVADVGASGLKDMGKTMAALKERHTGEMDFKAASAMVKELLK